MKKLIIGSLILTAVAFAACNDNGKSEEAGNINKDSAKRSSTVTDAAVAEITPTFTQVDAKTANYIKTLVGHYLHLKNALASDNSSEAASAANAMAGALNTVDKSLFTAEEKKVYDASEEGMKEDAEYIGKKSGDIEHQREHFSMMSEDIYALARAFGGGQTLYNDHCPMYKDKGAMWISEAMDIKNPYMGSKMATCGEVKEKIK